MRRVIHETVDDLDGTPDAETVEFAIDGVQYEIDLAEVNRAKLRKILEPYMDSARRTGRAGTTAATRGARPARRVVYGTDSNKDIREWAARNGITVAPRGRISSEIIEQYRAARVGPAAQ